MEEGEAREPSSDPFEEAYIAYLKAVQRAWADVDVDAVVSEARRHGHFHPMACWSCLGHPMGCWSCWAFIGTHGAHGDSASPGPAEPTER
jgi:hypothetical protein